MTAIADLPAIDQFKLALAAAMDEESFDGDDPDDRDELYPTPTTVEMALHVGDILNDGGGLMCAGYEQEVDLLADTVRLLAGALRSALDHTSVEVLHQRDPDGGCDLTVWVNGIETTVVAYDDIDPGRGYHVADWDEHIENLRSRPGLSDAFRSAAVAARLEARSSSCIDKDDSYDDEDGDDNGMEVEH